jgi:uncharacterized protein (DUF58 family)
VYAQLDRLRLRGARHLRGGRLGRRASLRRRPDADFREHRQYVPGDDVRFVDWKASARSEQIHLKQGELPQETTVHLLLDTSASMAWGSPPKHPAALRLAAALGYLALAHDDRLNVAPVTAGAPRPPIQIKGKAQFPALLKELRALPCGGRADLAASLHALARTHRGGLALILSDLLDVPDLPAALKPLPAPRWDVTVLHLLHPEELAPRLTGQVEMLDAESGAHANYDVTAQSLAAYAAHLQGWLDVVELACIESKVFYTRLSTGWALDAEMLPHLRRLGVLEAL